MVATFTGIPTAPDLRRSKAWRTLHNPDFWWRNTSNLTFVTYQRQNASLPNYSPNFGFEAGVIVQFIVDHYHALPDITVFIQDRPEQHNPHWLAWTRCLRPNVTYAPLTNARMSRLYRANAQTNKGTDVDDAIVEQCWRDMLDAFGVALLLPREMPILSYFQGSTFLVARSRLRATPLSTWRRVHAMVAGGDGRCHRGPLEWERLSVARQRHTRTLDTPDARGKHTSANAFEALQHILVGGMGREDVFSYDYCRTYLPDCEHTPCGRVRRADKYHHEMLGRVEFERRRLSRAYARLLRSLRHVATAARDEERLVAAQPGDTLAAAARKRTMAARLRHAGRGDTPMERAFWREFSGTLGE